MTRRLLPWGGALVMRATISHSPPKKLSGLALAVGGLAAWLIMHLFSAVPLSSGKAQLHCYLIIYPMPKKKK